MFTDFLASAYFWIKALHIISVIAWMAGLFYLPRLYVYHVEHAASNVELSNTFKTMELKLLRVIMNPAMILTWIFGILLLLTPGVVDWYSEFWVYVKLAALFALTWFHHSLAQWRKTFAADANTRPGRYYRGMNEVPTLLMAVIVIMVVVKPF
ncbi:MAG: protoporphyrinogen oxidase HemJ [Pseudomonadota bacterium]